MKNSILRITFYLFMAMQLVACKTQNLFQTGGKPAPPDSCFLPITSDYQYKIRQDDKISISVWDHDDLSVGSLYGIYNSNEIYGKWLLVDARGEISIPKVGPFKVRGLTVIQAEDTLRQVFAEWIKRPVVDVKVLNKEITVIGELKSPGKQVLEKDNNSLIEVIGKAGDFDFYADKRKVKIIRLWQGQVRNIDVDLTNMDRYMSSNIRIIPGDVVYVPSKKGKDFDKRISTILPIISVATGFALIYKAFF
jgi:polysaccharide export outer membrane protein